MNDTSYDLLLLLGDVGRLIRVEADRRARAHGLTRAQWVILARVEVAPGLSQRELAAILEVEPITVGRLVDRLEERGLVERRPDPLDRRVWRLHLRAAATAVLLPLEAQRRAIGALLCEGVAQPDLDRVVAALSMMRANMGASRRPAAYAAPRDAAAVA